MSIDRKKIENYLEVMKALARNRVAVHNWDSYGNYELLSEESGEKHWADEDETIQVIHSYLRY